MSTGEQTRALNIMFDGNSAWTIKPTEGSFFAVGAENGLHVVNMDNGVDSLHLLQGKCIYGMACVGSGEVLAGAM